MGIRNRVLLAHFPIESVARVDYFRWFRTLRFLSISNRNKPHALQFPQLVRALSLLMANGVPVSVAIQWITPKLSGFWHREFWLISKNLELGADLVLELQAMANRVNLIEVSEFSEKLSTAIERGVPVSAQLAALASSIESSMIRDLTKRAGANETKMLIPTVFLILPITVLFAIFPSLLVLRASY